LVCANDYNQWYQPCFTITTKYKYSLDKTDAGAKRSRESGNKESAEKTTKKENPDAPKNSKHENSEIHVLGLRTKKVADVEELLDKHKAHRKEEMREMNPEFFRHP